MGFGKQEGQWATRPPIKTGSRTGVGPGGRPRGSERRSLGDGVQPRPPERPRGPPPERGADRRRPDAQCCGFFLPQTVGLFFIFYFFRHYYNQCIIVLSMIMVRFTTSYVCHINMLNMHTIFFLPDSILLLLFIYRPHK